MNEEMKSQKEEFLMEVQKQLLHKGLKSEMQEDGRLHVKWNDQPLCEVDEYGRAWCRPVSVTCPEMKKSLRAVSKTASQVWEYMQIFARAPALKANGADGSYKILADFGEAVLAGRLEETGAKFATWQWEFGRNSVRVGHYFMEDYKAAKRDFAARSKLVESQRILSDAESSPAPFPAGSPVRRLRCASAHRRIPGDRCDTLPHFHTISFFFPPTPIISQTGRIPCWIAIKADLFQSKFTSQTLPDNTLPPYPPH